MTQEFHISVTPVGQDDYLVRTEQVAPGVPLAEELVSWPVADWLSAAAHLMNDPLTSVLQGDVIARNSVNLVALGQQFYNALFQGTLRDSWITAQGIAQNHQKILRLRLGLKDNKLASLPWEVMHAGDRPLATGPYVAFSRYQSGIGMSSRLSAKNIPIPSEDGGIKVLMVIASPTDKVRLDQLKQEAIKLQAELHRSGESSNHLPEIQLTLLQQPGREELTQALEQGRYHILHYSGHSNVGPNGGEIYLVSSRTGLTETLTGDDLAGLLVNNNIQMAVFNSCLGAYGVSSARNSETGERNLTETLVKRGIRSVLAMSERIPDDVALNLTQLFYRNLSQGYSVDLCVSRVRQGLISTYGSHQMYWALPILYLQSDFNGNLNGLDSPSNEFINEYNPVLSAAPASYSEKIDESDIPAVPLPIDDLISSYEPEESSGLDWLGEDTWGDLVDDVEYNDPSYAEDSAIVSDLFRQLDEQAATEQPMMNAELIQEFGDDTSPQQPYSAKQPVNDKAAGNMQNNFSFISGTDNSFEQRPISQIASLGTEEVAKWNEVAGLEKVNQDITHSVQSSHINRKLTGSRHTNSAVVNFKHFFKKNSWSAVGALSVTAITLVTLSWLWRGGDKSNLQSLPEIGELRNDTGRGRERPKINLKEDATGVVTQYAIDNLNRGELEAGLQAVEELLNRGTLSKAQAVLKSIPLPQIDNPSVNFLRGRLAWQFMQQRNTRSGYTVDDARRYWDSAVKADQNSSLYKNVVGFAYYAEGNLNRANDAWLQSLSLEIQPKNRSRAASSANSSGGKQKLSNNALQAYAGLALGFYKAASSQPPGKREQYLNEAIKMRNTVLDHDPLGFQVNELGKNWLWTDSAIRDWRAILRLKYQE
ncbi:MAG: CHAT domain-containing protein [Mastigocoleus sp. MO_167.B18]|nr:CHAT domain-containing protein [Mastigocoleus sp. MO_167.B18]